ncbi:hypothetical protein BAY61_22525 [Prauserella marina]|uniref:Cytochrome P450 n=1 Tax=Prauserella marina TaxID=530584 RepID=A0A222VTQ3_9PSEU|nr:cytochrome P450 [Prauserella marina]ASR37315.1 hypothetical protein BAY61_22525 [Prauserella marina]PWV74832.1 cytochrome P450 [Prauserella marina]SDD39542.1 Cytochrome P450 [Prauserella marina]
MSLLTDTTTGMRLYRSRLRLLRSAMLGDPVASILGMPRGTDGNARYERLREHGELVRGRSGLYMSASHRVCREVLRGKDFGAVPTATAKLRLRPPSWQRGDLLVHPLDDSFASADPPDHTRLRRIVAPLFTPAAIRERGAFVERVVAEELNRLDTREPVDLIGEFAIRVPSRVISEFLGLPPGNHDRYCRWGIEFGAVVDGAHGPGELRRTRRLLAEMADHFADLVAERRRAGNKGDDLLSVMIEAADRGDLTEAGLLATAEALLIGGFVTTANIIGNAVIALLATPEQRDLFAADTSQADRVVEETLRLVAPAQYSVRVAANPVTVGGTQLREGTPVVTLLAAANRDPSVFPDPGLFDFTRPNVREHLSFAAGVHYCIGAGLARLEGEIALRALFDRFPGLTAAGRPEYCPSRVIRGPQRLLIHPR